MILIWTEIFKFIGKQGYGEDLENKPDLSFEYDSLHYDIFKPIAKKMVGEEETNLTDEECLSVETFCKNYDYLVYPILEDGTSGDPIRTSQCEGPYAVTAMPTQIDAMHHYYNTEKNIWEYIYCVDDDGTYVGSKPFNECLHIVPDQSPSTLHAWNFDTQQWHIPEKSLNQLKTEAIAIVNNQTESMYSYGVIYDGYVFPISQDSIDTLTNNIENNILSHYDEDGDQIDFDAIEVLIFLKSKIEQMFNDINVKQNQKITDINSATTIEEYEEIMNRDYNSE